MGELIFKSPGVSTREIDLSGRSAVGPTGVPAGIIGTTNQGPAFVPVTVATFSEFQSIFGQSDGKKFGPLAVNEWLKNARSCTYLRVLGAGNCLQRASTGIVTNAGFVVGSETVQENGIVGNNALYANQTAAASIEGRTYFLGCLMSESNGCTVFSSAGIQGTTVWGGTVASKALTVVSTTMGATDTLVVADSFGGTLTITIGGAARDVTFVDGDFTAGGAVGAYTFAVTYNVAGTASPTEFAEGFINCLRAAAAYSTGAERFYVTCDEYVAAATEIVFRSTRGGSLSTPTITANDVGGTLAADLGLTDGVAVNLTGGSDGNAAAPILRGVLLAPSGVVLSLSGNACANGNNPVSTDTAVSAKGVIIPQTGGITGSLYLSSQNFTMLLNGYSNKEKNVITASFDVTSPTYFANVFNTDPFKIESEGHLLYGSYDIYPTLAAVTGAGVTMAGPGSKGAEPGIMGDIAFLLTSSIARGTEPDSAGSVPIYENFEDRFATPISPSVITQNYGGTPYNLFQVEALSDGAYANTRYKISIENIKKSTSTTYKYGLFDLTVRSFYDTDEEKIVLESFRGLSLDTSSEQYISRMIGDQNTYFDFDDESSSQKIIVEGDYPVRSNYVRIKPSNNLKNGNIPADALPMGFRGPSHLVTSGTMLCNEADSLYVVDSVLRHVRELPIPYRETVALSTGINKRADSRLYWGIQTNRKTVVNEPNKQSLFDSTFESYAKYFPNHIVGTTDFSVGENPGAANVNGSVLDCDLFNNNIFSLERIKVRTGSTANGGYADSEYWLSASYVRNGVIAIDTDLKTRAFKVADLERVANSRYAKFTFFLQGGFDGLNIFNEQKLEMTNTSVVREITDETGQFGTAGSSTAAYRKAVDIMGSKSDVDIQLLAIPGIRKSTVTDYAITAVENRFDAMYIMDLEERDTLNTVVTSSVQNISVLNTVNAFSNRGLDSSFAAVYFPDMVVEDPTTLGNVQVPPSVSVLGAFSLNDALAHPWFAPAGFTRGALESVELAAVRLNRTNLDDLYSADINPLTAFPGTGVVVWGQKTLMAAPSALDRVNVRRLLIDIRRSVRNVANSLLFEPNRQETLEKFSALVNPILQSVQEQSGVDRYKVVIDTTTTTQADVENNTIRGKIFLQPTRTAEFIALDFVVTNAGAEI